MKPEEQIADLTDKLASANARLREWETGFETSNPAQAIAEHRANLQKRAALQAQLNAAKIEATQLQRFEERLALLDADNKGLLDQLRAEKEAVRALREPAPKVEEPPSGG